MELSLEEICRVVLQAAVDDGIVTFNRNNFVNTEKPSDLTAGDLTAVANRLSEELVVK